VVEGGVPGELDVTRAPALAALAALAGCLPSLPGDDGPSECSSTDECNQAAGEVCDEGVCWGDPPAVELAAALGPSAAYQNTAAATEAPVVVVQPDGWFTDGDGDPLRLATAVHVTGRVRAPCPAILTACAEGLTVPAAVRWTRESGVPGAARITTQASATSDGFEVYLARPAVSTTYTVSVVPSSEPLGTNLPSPANLFPPRQFQVVLTRDDAEVPRDLDLSLTPLVTLQGRLTRGGAPLAPGWRVRAEAADPNAPGTSALVSNIAVSDAAGDYTLRVPSSLSVVDVVVDAPPIPDQPPARIRIRDQVVTSLLPVVDVPALDQLVAVPITVSGTDGNGDTIPAGSATVYAQLDQAIASGVYLSHTTSATTSTTGVAAIQLLLGSATVPYTYSIDVVPGPGSELASHYGVPVVVSDQVPDPTEVMLGRRVALTGILVDELGFPLEDTTIDAVLSDQALCQLSTSALRSARRLAAVQATTDSYGEFKLWLESDLDATTLTYDLAVEPPAGTWAPRWTFLDQAVQPGLVLALPAAAHVRATILDPAGVPAPDTVVSLFELTDRVPPCPQATRAGGAELRARATSDDEGVVRLILPRVTAATPR